MVKKMRGRSRKSFSDFVYDNFLVALKDLRKLRNYVIFTTILFFSVSVFGFLFPIFFEEEILNLIRNLIEQTENLGAVDLIAFIMTNNMQSAFFAMVLGIFFGILPIASLLINGYVLGFVVNKTMAVEGFFVILKLLPHGIFEIPAILISAALGMKIGFNLRNVRKNYKEAFRIFLLIVVPLLVFAGIIEGWLIAFFS